MTSISVVLAFGVFCSTKGQTEGIQYDEFSKLSFNIQTSKHDYVLLEPIPLFLNVRNDTGRPVKGHVDLNFSSLNLKVVVQNPDIITSKFTPTRIIDETLYEDGQTIAPNKRYEKRQLIEDGLDEFFSVAGEHKFWVEMCDEQCVLSNPVTVNIVLPEGKNREAFEDLKKLPNVFKSHPRIYKQALEDFVSRHHNSVYGNYFLYKLASQYMFFHEYEKAKETFGKIDYDFIFREEVEKELKIAERKLSESLRGNN
jgi:hypothetical protein